MRNTFESNLADHVPRMYRVALRIVGDCDKAHDVVQEACVKALRNIGRFDGRAELSTWLHRITTNCARDCLRKETREMTSADVELSDELTGMLTGVQKCPAAEAEKKELHAIAAAMVELLPDDCRLAFVLTQLDGYSYDEAAAIENKPRGTMASRVFRAKKILFEQMTARTGRRAES